MAYLLLNTLLSLHCTRSKNNVLRAQIMKNDKILWWIVVVPLIDSLESSRKPGRVEKGFR